MTINAETYASIRHDAGRKTKLTIELIQDFTQALKACATINAACQYVKVHRASYYEWRNRGATYDEHLANGGERQESEEIYLTFLLETEHALGFAEVRAASILAKEMQSDARWAAHFLAVRNPAEWSKATRLEHSGPGGTPIAMVDVTEVEARLASSLAERIVAARERDAVTDGARALPSNPLRPSVIDIEAHEPSDG